MPMCGNCAGGLTLLGYTVDVAVPYMKKAIDTKDFKQRYDKFENSLLLHSIWKCPHCHSIFLMVEE